MTEHTIDLDGLRALTLWRPWPDVIFAQPGDLEDAEPKDVENRAKLPGRPGAGGWSGVLVIHAGQKWDERGASIARRGSGCGSGTGTPRSATAGWSPAPTHTTPTAATVAARRGGPSPACGTCA